jgi:hypothetical protein
MGLRTHFVLNREPATIKMGKRVHNFSPKRFLSTGFRVCEIEFSNYSSKSK